MITNNVSSILEEKVKLEVECIDRMYLNGYVPMLQTGGGVSYYLRNHLGHAIASSVLMAPISRRFVEDIERFCSREAVDLIRFEKGQRKEDIAKEYLKRCPFHDGVLFVGKAQEKVSVWRTSKRINPDTGQRYPWLVRGNALPNQYYFYLTDEDFGPLFIKFSSYFPYSVKVCLNGHEYAKRQLDKEGLGYEALDNGILSCESPGRLQEICDGLSAEKIDGVVRKWFSRLPHPFTANDRAAGYRYNLSVLQAEFSLTQVFDRPQTGRQFFEEIIRENLDLGRPDHVQLIFSRRVTKRTPGRFRTRVITQGVVPSLHIQYKNSKIKQYHKEGRALRTETTINNTYDFAVGRLLKNLPALQEVGFAANRRLLDVQRLSHDCSIGEESFLSLTGPVTVDGQRASALKIGDERAMALLSALCLFSILPMGFQNRDLRERIAQLLGQDPNTYTPGRMTYDLRRLRLHGFIERIPHSNSYHVTQDGMRISLFITKLYARLFRPGLSAVMEGRRKTSQETARPPTHRRDLAKLETAMDQFVQAAGL
ncbi:MAG: hypothetical protein GY847_02195 [Proteobacteria bacterium]|nr:hypothetical protein [Pseudomonadota bacterium]